MTSFRMSIDGELIDGPDRFDVINPATEEMFAQAPQCSHDQLEEAISAAQRAFADWQRDEAARRYALVKGAEILKAHSEKLARTLTQEQGKPLVQAEREIKLACFRLKDMAGRPLPHEVALDEPANRIDICYRPYGVVAGITPWNFPIQIAISKLAPALLAGNTMVLKPSPYTPLSTLLLGELLNLALPPGVLNIVSGGNDLGEQLTTHPLVRMISFTGSVATGKLIAKAAASDLKRINLELGGNDAAIVLDDVDPVEVGTKLFWAAFANCGQVCLAVKRVYVPEALFDPLVATVARLANGARVGDGMDPETQIGPLNNAMQLEKVTAMVEEARQRGAVIQTGGERLKRKGYFFAPTVLTKVDDTMTIVAEEQFGPVLPILPYRDPEDAITRANATPYGLGGSVWSSDMERAREMADRVEAGTVWINQHMVLTPHAPFGGAKWSGIGESMGRWGIEAFMQKQVINMMRG